MGPRELFHAIVLVVDLVWMTCFYLIAKNNRKHLTIFLFALAALHLTVSVIAAFWTLRQFGLEAYAAADLFPEAVFFHLPPMLLISSFFLRQGKWAVRMLAFFMIISYVFVCFIESNWIEVTHYSYTHPMLSKLKRPIRIVHVGELQIHEVGAFESRILSQVQSLRPDLVAFTGDYFHCWNVEEEREQALRLQALLRKIRINAPLGMYAIKGDSDSFQVMKILCDGTGLQFLDNEVRPLKLPGVDVTLIGLSGFYSRMDTHEKMEPILDQLKGGLFNLFISHTADFVDTMSEPDGAYLVISGHAHQGQLEIPFVGALATPSRIPEKYADGLHNYGIGTLSITRGLGMGRRDFPSIHLLCRPEIRVLEVQPYDQRR